MCDAVFSILSLQISRDLNRPLPVQLYLSSLILTQTECRSDINMTRLLVLCCFSLLLAGVFGADFTVSLMKGDDVTLPINAGEIRGNETLQWKFNGKNMATIDLEVIKSQLNNIDGRFTNRLNLDRTTGSLTIKNIRTEETGEYQLKIKGIRDKEYKTLKTFSVTVTDQAYTVSVVKRGYSFSLSIGDKIQTDPVKWTFKGTDLTNGRFPNTNINPQTGELKITNIKPDQSGEYEVKIDGSSLILHRTFRVNINDEVKSESGTEEKSITLNIDNETQSDDVIEWKFKNTLIAKVDRRISPHTDILDERFRDRLDVNSHGYLIIKELFKIDSGLYEVNITNSKRIIQERISLTVTDGVSGADVTVSVMKGDDVTLPVNAAEIRGDERLQWKFKDNIIANIDLEVITSQLNYLDERFRNRLNLDRTTGSLTIKNIRTEDSGEYQLKIKGIRDKEYKTLKTFSVTVTADEVKSVSVPAGETVTLNTDTQTQTDDVIEWKFENTLIAKMDRRIHPHPDFPDERFRDRLHVNTRGSLIIINFKTEDSGVYDVSITNSKHIIQKRFSLTVSGADEVKSVSGVEGGSITLNIDNETQADDVIEWKFENALIAKVDRRISPHPDFPDERFRDRLDVNTRGSLIIAQIKTEDSGLYYVNSKRIILKRFSLTVSGGPNPGITVLSVLVALLVIVVVILSLFICKCKKKHFYKQGMCKK